MAIIDDETHLPRGEAETVASNASGLGLPTAAAPGAAVFTPGTVLANRYRVVGLLGKGGMGEVYRADDLTLGHPVALKFLPASVGGDPQRLDRFLAEVRSARQIAHPNVCRVYDIGSTDGQYFISMEYVDGEDLAGLLRRIGRLPSDKGLEIARQLCAALGAVHDRGLLHCDLKPANVMLDGRGKVRLTDFGLVTEAMDAARPPGSAVTGTPAYMAPEQLAGGPPSVQSDLYALGLVLHEVFTGRRVFAAATIAQLREQQEGFRVGDLSSTSLELDPAVERAIETCLNRDARRRPASAFAVAAALPGGDPLAAVLAAGETPSPDLVAAAGEQGGISLRTAWACLVVLVLGTATLFAIRAQASVFARVPFELSPDVLAHRAREVLGRLGYTGRPVDEAYGLILDRDAVRWEREHGGTGGWAVPPRDRPTGALFWYRASPTPLVAGRWVGGAERISGRITRGDPPHVEPGMASLALTTDGRLVALSVLPPEVEPPRGGSEPAPVAWDVVLREAGFDAGVLTASPTRVPPSWGDLRAAWTVTSGGVPLHLEASAYRGRPVAFTVVGPWTRSGTEQHQAPPGERAGEMLRLVLICLLLVGAAVLARQNLRAGRGDRRGAERLALLLFTVFSLAWAVGTHHVADTDEVGQFFMAASNGLFNGAFVWLLYLAVEPHVRRRWPHALISWSRLLSGRGADPLVGRDIVVGAVAGVLLSVLTGSVLLVQHRVGRVVPEPITPNLEALLGPGSALGHALIGVFASFFGSLTLFLMLFLFKLLVRSTYAAAAVLVGVLVLNNVLGAPNAIVTGFTALAVVSAMVWVLVRFGLVAFGVAQYVAFLLELFPIWPDLNAWHAWSTVFALGLVGAIAAAGFRAALAGRSLFGP